MKPLAVLSVAAVIVTTGSLPAHADSFSLGIRDRNVAIGVQLGSPTVAYAQTPVVAYAPRPYCPPRYYAPPVAVYQSGYWGPHRYYGYERARWHDEDRYRRWHDDRDRWRR